MTTEEIISISALELGKAIKEGKTSSVEACHAYLSRIDDRDGLYNSYITVLQKKHSSAPHRLTRISQQAGSRALSQAFP